MQHALGLPELQQRYPYVCPSALVQLLQELLRHRQHAANAPVFPGSSSLLDPGTKHFVVSVHVPLAGPADPHLLDSMRHVMTKSRLHNQEQDSECILCPQRWPQLSFISAPQAEKHVARLNLYIPDRHTGSNYSGLNGFFEAAVL